VTRRFDRIRTARLIMRRWRDDDRAPFAVMNADPEVMRYFPATLDRAASDASVDRIEELFDLQGFGLWVLELASTGEFIGFTGLNPMPAGVPGAGGMEVGWRLMKQAWHQGYATEAAGAAIEVGFGGAGLDQIWSMTAVLNEPSQAVMRRLGMTPYIWFGHPKIEAGHPLRPHILYRLQRPADADRLRPGAERRLAGAGGQRRVRVVHPIAEQRPGLARVDDLLDAEPLRGPQRAAHRVQPGPDLGEQRGGIVGALQVPVATSCRQKITDRPGDRTGGTAGWRPDR
jgi:RimJ/RimL family protein N-acetyltransferase